MNRTELVAAIAEKTELSKKDAEKALKAFTDVIAEELKKQQRDTAVSALNKRREFRHILANTVLISTMKQLVNSMSMTKTVLRICSMFSISVTTQQRLMTRNG